RDDRADDRELSPSSGRNRRRSRQADREAAAADRQRATATFGGVERERHRLSARGVHSRAVRSAGRPRPRRGGGRVPESRDDLPGAQRTGQSPGALPDGAGGGAGKRRGNLPGAIAGDDRRSVGHSQGGGRLSAARYRVSRSASG